MSEQQREHPHYPVTELELYQIRNDCKYPDRKDCNGCEGENSDCCFSTNHLIDEILTRSASRPHPSPAHSGCNGCRKEIEHLECPTPGNCDQMKCVLCCEGSDFPTLPEEIKKYEAAAARKAREDYAKEIELKLRECRCTEGYEPNYMGCGSCPFFINYDEGIECALQSLQSTQQQAGEQHE